MLFTVLLRLCIFTILWLKTGGKRSLRVRQFGRVGIHGELDIAQSKGDTAETSSTEAEAPERLAMKAQPMKQAEKHKKEGEDGETGHRRQEGEVP